MSNEFALPAAPARRRPWLAAALLAVVLSCESQAQVPAVEPLPSLAPMLERVSPAVVNISVSGRITGQNPLADDPILRDLFPVPRERDFMSAGSGVIVDAQAGHILTNHHVVANAQDITITLLDNRSMRARVVGTDEASDIAVLQVEADRLAEMGFGDSSGTRVGDFVVAIGNPFGFSHTVTSGIVSGLGRSGVNPSRDAYEDFIQTDASINPGNSGGALVNMRGELIGINSAIFSRSGGNIGIGFAIPVDMARDVMEQLVLHGEVSRGLLGVGIRSITPDVAQERGLPRTAGALILSVQPDSAAAEAGLMVDDVIVRIDGNAVRDSSSLRAVIGLRRPGERVRVGFLRDGREQSATAVLGTAATAAALSPEPAEAIDNVFAGAELTPFGSDFVQGLLVASVEPGSPAAAGGLRENDLIVLVNRERVRSVADARRIVEGARAIELTVERDGSTLLLRMR